MPKATVGVVVRMLGMGTEHLSPRTRQELGRVTQLRRAKCASSPQLHLSASLFKHSLGFSRRKQATGPAGDNTMSSAVSFDEEWHYYCSAWLVKVI